MHPTVRRIVVLRRPTAAAAVVAAIPQVYDTTFGSGTGSDGLSVTPLRSGAKRVWADSTRPDDTGDGLTAATAKKTWAAAYALITDGAGDHLMMAGTFTEAFTNIRNKSGFSTTYPMMTRSYDRTDPTNTAKYGRSPRAVVCSGRTGTILNSLGSAGQNDYLAFQGLDFSPTQAIDNAISFVGIHRYLLLENCIIRHTGVSTAITDGTSHPSHIIRKCAIYGAYSLSAHAIPFFTSSVDGLVIEDCVIINAGYPYGSAYGRNTVKPTASTTSGDITNGNSTFTVASATGIVSGQFINGPGIPAGTCAVISGTTVTMRSLTTGGALVTATSTPGAGASVVFGAYYADIFQHNIYLSAENGSCIVRRCILADASSHGIQARSGGDVSYNVFIDNAIHMLAGGGDDYGRGYTGSRLTFFNLTGIPTAGDTISITIGANTSTFTFVASGAAGNQINIGASATATVTAAIAVINACTDPAIVALKTGPSYNSVAPGVRAFSGTQIDVCYNPGSNSDAQITIAKSSSVVSLIQRTLNTAYNYDAVTTNGTIGYRPSGVTADVHHNLVIGGADINASLPRKFGAQFSNTTTSTKFRQNLMLDNVGGTPFDVLSQFAQPSYANQYSNAQSNVGTGAAGNQNTAGLSSFSSYIQNNNIWDFATSGSNTNVSSVTFTAARTQAQIYAAASAASGFAFTTKATMLAVAIENPEVCWAKYMIEQSMPGYGISYVDL